jgi:general secretion pathway protein K
VRLATLASARSERGVALMLVLWIIVVLGLIATGVAIQARESIAVASTARTRTVARYAAESGVQAASAALRDLLTKADTPERQVHVLRDLEDELQRWAVRGLGNARFQVVVTDLNARVDLNNSAETVLLGLFQQFTSEREAEALLNALLDWIDEDDEPLPGGAESSGYIANGSPFTPTNQPLQRLEELSRIRGFGDSITNLLAPYLTVWSDGPINVNTASEQVLAAVPEIGKFGAQALVAARRGGSVMTSKVAVYSELSERNPGAVSSQLPNITTVPRRILIVSRGWEAGQPLTHEIQAVLQLRGTRMVGEQHLSMRYWMERDR